MTNSNATIPVFFASDDNYLPFLAVAMRSLIDNLSPDACCDIHILNNGLTAEKTQPLLAMATDKVAVHLVDVSREIAPLAEKLNLRDYYTASIYFRLFIPSLFPQYHKAIYLDADIVVNGDIAELYATNLGNRLVGAVPDDIVAGHRDFRNYSDQGLGIPYQQYFNSGVMLMNLDQFRIQEIERKFVYLLNTYHFDTICPDQDYLNILCRNRVLYLDKGWDKMSVNDEYNGTPNLIHYNMFYKPWQYKNICYQEFFWEYAQKTPYYNDIRKMQSEFGWKDKWGHKVAHRTLRRSARQITKSDRNFRCVLQNIPVNEGTDWMKAHEA